jgi:hypothetical protein
VLKCKSSYLAAPKRGLTVVLGRGIISGHILFSASLARKWLGKEGKFWQMMCESFSILSLKIDAGSCNGTVRICSHSVTG